MKTLIAALLAAFGASSANGAEPPTVVKMPVDSIMFTMPTIAMDEIEFLPVAGQADGAPQFHEDNWSQVEFFSRSRLSEVKKLLKELKSFEAANRLQHGWKKIYKRKITRLALGVSRLDIERELQAGRRAAPILTTSSYRLGQVRHGFSLELGKNAYLYGLQQGEQVTILGASLQGADDRLLSTAFTKLNKKFGLFLVDWRQQLVLVNMDKAGYVEVWRP